MGEPRVAASSLSGAYYFAQPDCRIAQRRTGGYQHSVLSTQSSVLSPDVPHLSASAREFFVFFSEILKIFKKNPIPRF